VSPNGPSPDSPIHADRGADCPPLLYGTAWKGTRTAGLVERALELGFRGIDTACQPKHYDEAGVGRGLAACLGRGLRRADVYVQTKFTPLGGQDPERVPYDPEAPLRDQVQQSCAASLRNLGVSQLDAWLLHSPFERQADTREAWRGMEDAVDAGLVRALGISNCYDPAVLSSLWRSARIKPSLVQNRFHDKTGYDRQLRAFCTEHGLRYQSFWTLTANAAVLASVELRAIARRHSASPAQVFFAYAGARGITPLSGTCSEEHMRDDLSLPTLSPGESATIDRLLGL
jgi:diketogulonate reductase-like aldo/keto reductase